MEIGEICSKLLHGSKVEEEKVIEILPHLKNVKLFDTQSKKGISFEHISFEDIKDRFIDLREYSEDAGFGITSNFLYNIKQRRKKVKIRIKQTGFFFAYFGSLPYNNQIIIKGQLM